MAHSMHYMKTGCPSEIYQISGFQNHFQTKSNLCISICQTKSKKNQFAMTDPVTASTKATRKKYATFFKSLYTYPVVFVTPLDLLNGLARKPTDE